MKRKYMCYFRFWGVNSGTDCQYNQYRTDYMSYVTQKLIN